MKIKGFFIVFFLMFLAFAQFSVFGNPFLSAPSGSQGFENSEDAKDEKNDKYAENVENNEKSRSAPQIRLGQTSEKNLQVQRSVREILGESFYEWQSLHLSLDPAEKKRAHLIFWTILGAAFVFGLFHALGPGHRKTIVFSLYISKKAPWWEPLVVSLSLSALHAGSAIVLILLLNGIRGSISAKADTVSKWMEGLSYLLLILTAIFLFIHSLVEHSAYIKKKKNTENASQIIERKHLSLGAFIFSGIYPCPGAVLVLVLSFTLQVVGLGILSVLVMSIGMSIPILASAYLAWAGRESLFYLIKEKEAVVENLSFFIELFGYVLLLAFSLYIAWPFILHLF